MKHIIVVDHPEEWKLQLPEVEVVAANRYISDDYFSSLQRIKVFNLCRSYRYQSAGYYVSLLAQARGHYAIPSVTTLQDIRIDSVLKHASHDLEVQIQNSLGKLKSREFELSIYFGQNIAQTYSRLAAAIFNLFPVPFSRVNFTRVKDRWIIDRIRVIAAKDIPEHHYDFVRERILSYFGRRDLDNGKKSTYRYEMAMLVDQYEAFPPSNAKAIERFQQAAHRMGMGLTFIGPNDMGDLDRYDALFIRVTTAVNHFSYRFARRAELAGLAVIDDPLSIIRCTNKAFLSEALTVKRIPTPRSRIVTEQNLEAAVAEIGFPLVVKTPDGSFSRGVFKIKDRDELNRMSSEIFEDSEMLLMQQFLPTEFDWRVGVLNSQPLFACKYFMVKGHWQIYQHHNRGTRIGRFETLNLYEVPADILEIALNAARVVGDGLYGVDIKQTPEGPMVIEVNDNPNIDGGVEDQALKGELYDIIIRDFIRRINILRTS